MVKTDHALLRHGAGRGEHIFPLYCDVFAARIFCKEILYLSDRNE